MSLIAGAVVALGLVSVAIPAMAGGYHHHHHKKTYTYQSPGGAGPDGTTYFGTCLNLAGFQQAGNAGADGFCLPFGSIVGSVNDAGYCTTTEWKRVRGDGIRGKVEVSSTSPGSCPEKKSWGGMSR